MTVLVGVRCADGVVVGADSMATSGIPGSVGLMRMASEKISVIGERVIVAGTGAVGLGQRFRDTVQSAWNKKLFQKSCVDCCRELTHAAVNDFRNTGVPYNSQFGYNFGALVAAPLDDHPNLIEFGLADFQPEIKTDKLHFVSMGSGQMLYPN